MNWIKYGQPGRGERCRRETAAPAAVRPLRATASGLQRLGGEPPRGRKQLRWSRNPDMFRIQLARQLAQPLQPQPTPESREPETPVVAANRATRLVASTPKSPQAGTTAEARPAKDGITYPAEHRHSPQQKPVGRHWPPAKHSATGQARRHAAPPEKAGPSGWRGASPPCTIRGPAVDISWTTDVSSTARSSLFPDTFPSHATDASSAAVGQPGPRRRQQADFLATVPDISDFHSLYDPAATDQDRRWAADTSPVGNAEAPGPSGLGPDDSAATGASQPASPRSAVVPGPGLQEQPEALWQNQSAAASSWQSEDESAAEDHIATVLRRKPTDAGSSACDRPPPKQRMTLSVIFQELLYVPVNTHHSIQTGMQHPEFWTPLFRGWDGPVAPASQKRPEPSHFGVRPEGRLGGRVLHAAAKTCLNRDAAPQLIKEPVNSNAVHKDQRQTQSRLDADDSQNHLEASMDTFTSNTETSEQRFSSKISGAQARIRQASGSESILGEVGAHREARQRAAQPSREPAVELARGAEPQPGDTSDESWASHRLTSRDDDWLRVGDTTFVVAPQPARPRASLDATFVVPPTDDPLNHTFNKPQAGTPRCVPQQHQGRSGERSRDAHYAVRGGYGRPATDERPSPQRSPPRRATSVCCPPTPVRVVLELSDRAVQAGPPHSQRRSVQTQTSRPPSPEVPSRATAATQTSPPAPENPSSGPTCQCSCNITTRHTVASSVKLTEAADFATPEGVEMDGWALENDIDRAEKTDGSHSSLTPVNITWFREALAETSAQAMSLGADETTPVAQDTHDLMINTRICDPTATLHFDTLEGVTPLIRLRSTLELPREAPRPEADMETSCHVAGLEVTETATGLPTCQAACVKNTTHAAAAGQQLTDETFSPLDCGRSNEDGISAEPFRPEISGVALKGDIGTEMTPERQLCNSTCSPSQTSVMSLQNERLSSLDEDNVQPLTPFSREFPVREEKACAAESERSQAPTKPSRADVSSVKRSNFRPPFAAVISHVSPDPESAAVAALNPASSAAVAAVNPASSAAVAALSSASSAAVAALSSAPSAVVAALSSASSAAVAALSSAPSAVVAALNPAPSEAVAALSPAETCSSLDADTQMSTPSTP